MRARAGVSFGFIAVSTAMFWVTLAIAAAAMWPIYQSFEFITLAVTVLFIGSLIAILGAVLRLSSVVVMLATVVGYLIFGVPLAVPSQALYGLLPSLGGLAELFAGTALGWKQLVTITLPVGSFEALLVPAFVLLLVGTVVGLSIALRTRNGEVAVVIPVVVFVTAILFGPASTNWPLPLALMMLVAGLVWLIWARWYRRRAAIRLLVAAPASGTGRVVESRDTRLGIRTLIGATLSMAIAVSASVTAVWLFPTTQNREVLRTAVEQPFDPRDYASPLSGFRSYLQPEHERQTMFTVSGLPEDARIRIATLDSYNGIVYSVGSDKVTSLSGSFVRVPTSFDQSAVDGTHITYTVAIDNYNGVWMPTVGKLEDVTFTGRDAAAMRGSFFYNDNSGTAAVVDTVGSGDTYRVDAVIPVAPNAAQIARLEPGNAQVPEPGFLPEALASTLGGYIGDAETSGARLQAMLAGLRAEGYISHGVSDSEPASRSGHAADRITELLTARRMIGDDEQYAVTAALMASELGFPSRVVFGFAPDSIVPDGVTTVRGDDVSAWIEVNTTRFGWVAFDPSPEPREIPEAEPEDPTQVARPQSPVQPPQDEPDQRDEQLQPDATQDDPVLPDPVLALLLGIAQALGLTLLIVTILLSPFIVVVVAKLRRRHLRRKARSPVVRISGGWQEFEDAVVDHGYSPPSSPTRSEVARTVGGTRSLILASVADRAVFSPEATDTLEAEKVWRAVDELRASLGYGVTRWKRIKALVSVRSLGGYSVKRLFRR